MNKIKKCLQTLLNHFVKQSEKADIGTLDMSRAITKTVTCDSLGVWNTNYFVPPFSGFCVFFCPFNVTELSIHSRFTKFGDFSRCGILDDTKGKWHTVNTQVVKGYELVLDCRPKEKGTAQISFIPYKNT